MVSFSKPVQGSSSAQGSSSTAESIPAKRKRIPNSKLTDENNVDKEAVKRRKQEAAHRKTASKNHDAPSEAETVPDVDEEITFQLDDPHLVRLDDEAGNASDKSDDDIEMIEEVPAETAEQELGELRLIRTFIL